MKNKIQRTILILCLGLSAAALSSCETKVVEVHHYYHTVTPAPDNTAPENYKVVNSYDQ